MTEVVLQALRTEDHASEIAWKKDLLALANEVFNFTFGWNGNRFFMARPLFTGKSLGKFFDNGRNSAEQVFSRLELGVAFTG